MALSIGLHTWDIKIHWSSPLKYYWTKDFHVFYSLHRGGNIFSIKFYVYDVFIILYLVAVLHYYLYKRASLRLADPRFYESSTWIQNQFSLP